MPISRIALKGLSAAVEWNPAAAQLLLDMLRTAPSCVRYKPEDRYGPLGLLLRPVAGKLTLSKENLLAYEVFNRAWLAQEFSKAELADTIERLLAGLGFPKHAPDRYDPQGWMKLAPGSDSPDPRG